MATRLNFTISDSRLSGRIAFSAAFVALALLAVNAPAAYFDWNVSSGDWASTSSWNPNTAIPTSLDTAYIRNGGIASVSQASSALVLGIGYTGYGTGELDITAGSLNIQVYALVGNSNDGSVKQSGGAVTLQNLSTLAYSSLQVGGYAGSAYANVTGIYELSGGTLTAGAETIGSFGTGVFTQTGGTNTAYTNLILGAYSSGNGTYTLSGSNSVLSLSKALVGSYGTGVIVQKSGTVSITGTLSLAMSAASAKGVYNLEGGTFILGGLKSGLGAASVNLGGGTLQAAASFTGTTATTLTGINGSATIDTVGYTVAFDAPISGDGGLIKKGSGSLVLSGADSYKGATSVEAGTLVVNGSLNAAGNVAVASGSTLAGTGSVGSVSVSSGGHISAGGTSVGTLTVAGDLTLSSGAKLDFDLGAVAASDKISATASTLSIVDLGFSNFTFNTALTFDAGVYTLIDASSIVGSLNSSDLSGSLGGLTGTLSVVGGDVVLTVVPEPSTLVLIAVALSSVPFVFKRRRQ